MVYAASEEGINALNSMANDLEAAVESLTNNVKNMSAAADEHPDTLGPHKDSLDEALENIQTSIESAAEPAGSVAEILREVAEGYQEIVDNDRFKGTSGN